MKVMNYAPFTESKIIPSSCVRVHGKDLGISSALDNWRTELFDTVLFADWGGEGLGRGE